MDNQLTIEIACKGYTAFPLEELHDLQGNLKDLTEENYVRLRNAMTKFGFSFPVFVWVDPTDNTKYIIDAHQRLRTLRKMKQEGWTIPDLPADIIEAKDRVEAKKKLLLLNSRYGKMTREGFDEFIDEVGFEVDNEIEDMLVLPEIEMWVDEENTQVTEDEAPEVSQEPALSHVGEVYQLGRHRLMCGDATKIEDVEKLMNGQKVDMVFTDPPYGYSYKSNHQDKHDVLLNDDKILDFLPLTIAYTKDNAPIYTFCGWQTVDKWIALIKANGLTLKNIIIWKKNNWSMGDLEGAYAGQYEVILYCPKGRVLLEGERDRDIWEFDREEQSDHPTKKPLALISHALSNHKVDSVLDLFGGSGSTLIACEQTNRTCYMSELDPKYVDVIRKRYAKFIGQEENWQEITPIANDSVTQPHI